jgi:hypothetical protein
MLRLLGLSLKVRPVAAKVATFNLVDITLRCSTSESRIKARRRREMIRDYYVAAKLEELFDGLVFVSDSRNLFRQQHPKYCE